MDDATRHLKAFLDALGFRGDPEMEDTARRFAELMASFVPRDPEPPTLCATTSPSPVVVADIPFHSLCAHHLLPFYGRVSVGYAPRDRLLGLGSIPRLVRSLARRPQLQERFGEQLADALVSAAEPASVVVVVRAHHLCVEMRGAELPAEIITLASRGAPDPWLTARVSGG